jgi:hypothetical protein
VLFQILQGPLGLLRLVELVLAFQEFEKGSPLSPSREMNLFRAAIHPVSFCTSLIVAGASMSVMAVIFIGLASVPRLLMMNPSNFPDCTPKMHLVGLSFHRNLRRLPNVSSKSAIRSSGFLVLMTMSST